MQPLETLGARLGWMVYYADGELSFGRRFEDDKHARAAYRILDASLRDAARELERRYTLSGIENLGESDRS